MKRYIAVIVAVIFAVFAVGCASNYKTADDVEYIVQSSEYNSSMEEDFDYYAEEEAEAPMETAEPAEPEMAGGASEEAIERYGGRKVIRTYEVSIRSSDFDADMQTLTDRAAKLGGYAQSAHVNGKKPEIYGDPGRDAYLTLRIPTEHADEFIQGVKGIGTLLSYYDTADDITDAYFDVDTRLGVLEIQLERLQSILVETDNLADIIALEERISEVMLEIEQLTGTLNKYDALIDYTTVTINLYEESLKQGPADEESTWERIGRGFTDSLYSVGVFFVDFFVGFVSSLPVLVVIAAFGVGVFFVIRAIIRASHKKTGAKSAKQVEEAKNSGKIEDNNDKEQK